MEQPAVERHVYLKLRTSADRAEVVGAARAVLPTVIGVQGVRVGTPADPASEVWDVCFVVRFGSRADLDAYLADPVHRRFVEEVLEPRVEVRKAWNFDVG